MQKAAEVSWIICWNFIIFINILILISKKSFQPLKYIVLIIVKLKSKIFFSLLKSLEKDYPQIMGIIRCLPSNNNGTLKVYDSSVECQWYQQPQNIYLISKNIEWHMSSFYLFCQISISCNFQIINFHLSISNLFIFII